MEPKLPGVSEFSDAGSKRHQFLFRDMTGSFHDSLRSIEYSLSMEPEAECLIRSIYQLDNVVTDTVE